MFYKLPNYLWLGDKYMTSSLNKSVRYRNRQKQKAVEYLGGECSICGYKKSLAALEFHHIDPTKKDWNPSRVMSYRWDIIKSELDKCKLLCSNCHRELHQGITEFSLRRSPSGQKKVYTKECAKCETKFNSENAGRNFCSRGCANLHRTKINWPEVTDLITQIKNTNFTIVAKKLGVSDNAVRKYLVKNNIDFKNI